MTSCPQFEDKIFDLVLKLSYKVHMSFRQEQNDFWRTAVRTEFVRRCQDNPAYSLRAFSNFLEIDQSLLSKVLNGQRNVTPSFIDSVSQKLNVSPFQSTNKKTSELSHYSFIEKNNYTVLDHWYYFAILELFKTKDFKPSPSHISNRLTTTAGSIKMACVKKNNPYRKS